MKTVADTLFEVVVRSVPQWYFADCGPKSYPLQVGEREATFFSQRPLTPALTNLYHWIGGRLGTWKASLPAVPTPTTIAKISEEIALHWLSMHARNVEWDRVLGYCEELRLQTHENEGVSRNLIVCPNRHGLVDISDAVFAKPFAKLAGGSDTFFRVDGGVRFLAYEEVTLDAVKEVQEYKFHPDFLHPVWSQLAPDEYSVHLTSRGDLVIMDRNGMLAACRRGRWYIYDVQTFKNFVVDVLGNYRVGCNLFDIVFDLSYRRHGALLVYDPNHSVLGNVVNQGAIIGGTAPTPDPPRALLRDVIGSIAMSKTALKDRRKRCLLEVAGIDGAVIFDDKNVLAFGAIVRTHDLAGQQHGARTTAAASAFLWGGIPIKCSADGDIGVLFRSQAPHGQVVGAYTEFM